MGASWILALDQGTTSSRAILFDPAGRPTASGRRELAQSFPGPGRVEHAPEEIWQGTLEACREALAGADAEVSQVAGIGITNQRETTVLWDRSTGEPVHPAVVWQDRRTADRCRELREAGHEEEIQARTGLLLDPYFSATKLEWLLDHVSGAREAAERGELAFGTVDSWLLWKLTDGRVHATDATNASRTLLFDIHRQRWDRDLLELFRVPESLLPEVRDSAGPFGETDPELFGRPLPVTGIAGDQQAATFGQAAFEQGQAKLTCGTGAFLLLNTGNEAVRSGHRLLSTVAWRLEGRPTYALEGSVFSAGSAIQWLRDGLGIVDHVEETEALASKAREESEVYLVPAFTGLGAPYWDPDARGALLGLTRDAGRPELARAALQAVGYQAADLMAAMEADGAPRPAVLAVDGGLSENDWAMAFLSDVVGAPVERPAVIETTAVGAARLAGLGAGIYRTLDETAELRRVDRRWEPSLPEGRREELLAGWRRAVDRVLTTEEDGERGP